MTSTTSPEASEIRRKSRQRLIGAIAIAVLLVVFVPMVLDSEQRPAHTGPALDIPSKDKAPPLPPPSAPLIPHKPLPPVPVTPGAAGPAPVTPGAAGSTPVTPGAAGQQRPGAPSPTAAPSTPKLEGFAVQVGAFKDEEKLKQVREKLVNAGVPFYVERHDTSAGELKRVRAGPFPTREAAEAGLAKIKLGALDGQVVPLP